MSCSSPAARTSEVTDHLAVVLKITLVVFIASSLLDMGLRLDPPGIDFGANDFELHARYEVHLDRSRSGYWPCWSD